MIGQGVNLITRGMVIHKSCTLFTKGIILCDYIPEPIEPQAVSYGGTSWRRPTYKESQPSYKEISIVFEFNGDKKTMIKKKYQGVSVKKYDQVEIREGYLQSPIDVIFSKKLH
jgi:hypothetical protein